MKLYDKKRFAWLEGMRRKKSILMTDGMEQAFDEVGSDENTLQAVCSIGSATEYKKSLGQVS